MRSLYKYCKKYSGKEPQLIEGDIFKTIIPLTEQITQQATQQATQQDELDKTKKILEFCIQPKSRLEIQQFLGLKDREYLRTEILNPLIKKGLISLTIPDKPKSPKQKYYSK